MYVALVKDWNNHDWLMEYIGQCADKLEKVAPFDEDNRMVVNPNKR
jgi:hypothetical protein